METVDEIIKTSTMLQQKITELAEAIANYEITAAEAVVELDKFYNNNIAKNMVDK